MPVQNKLAALHDAVEQVSNLIDENEALLSSVRRLRTERDAARKAQAEAQAAYDTLSQRMHRWLLTPGVVDALKNAGVSDDL